MAKHTKLIYDFLVGKNDLDKNLDKASKSSSKVEKSSKNIGNNFSGAGSSISGMIGPLAAVAATAVTVVAAFGGISAAIGAASKQEEAVNQLNTALRQSGEFSKEASKGIQAFASSLQQQSTIGDEVILQQIALAKNFGLSNKEAQELVKAAVDLSAATGISLDSAVRNLGKTYGGLTGELGELVPSIRTLTKEQLISGEATKVISKQFNGFAKAQTKTFKGALSQSINSFGDLLEKIGEFITKSPIIIKLINIASQFFEGLSKRIESSTGALDVVGDLIIGTLKILARLGQTFATVFRIPILLIGQIIKGWKELLGLLGEFAEKFGVFDKVGTFFDKINKTSRDLSGKNFLDDFANSAFDFAKGLENSTSGTDKLAKGFRTVSGEVSKVNKNLTKTNQQIEKSTKLASKSLKDFSGLQKTLQAGSGVVRGRSGATSTTTQLARIGADAILPGLGQALGPFIGALAQGPDFVRSQVREFAKALPEVIEALIEAAPVLIEEIANQLPYIVERLAEKSDIIVIKLAEAMPRVALALALAMPRVAIALIKGGTKAGIRFTGEVLKGATGFVGEILKGASEFINKIVDGVNNAIGNATGGLLGGSGGGFIGGVVNTVSGAVGGLFGGGGGGGFFAQGGEIPAGFPNDTFKANLTSGELVIDRSTNQLLKQALISGSLNGGEQVQVVRTSVEVNNKAFADIILELSRTNQRLA